MTGKKMDPKKIQLVTLKRKIKEKKDQLGTFEDNYASGNSIARTKTELSELRRRYNELKAEMKAEELSEYIRKNNQKIKQRVETEKMEREDKDPNDITVTEEEIIAKAQMMMDQ